VDGDSASQLDSPLTGLTPGSRVGGYRLERLVGVGGMASVYQAREERLGRVVALKVLAGDAALRARFIREAHAVAAVDHPHIIPVYAAGDADGMQFIAMRFVPGDTLQGVIRVSGALPPKRAASFISQVGSALDAAHAAGLVHRDVKPGNILVDARRGGPEHAYLTDFGIARAMLSAGTLTVAGQFLGTPDYAAPEQINGGPVDGRADQYGLACVAYEVLSGAVPFRRDSAWSVLYAHLNEPPPLIPGHLGLPSAVHDVLAQAMAKSPPDRYSACGDFADALREALGLDPYDPARSAQPPRPRTPTLPLPQPAPATPTAQLAPTVEEAPAVPVAPRVQMPPRAQLTRLDATVGPTAPDPVNGAGPGAPPTVTWTAVVTADRAYFDRVSAVDDQDTGSISFPGDLPERRIPLTGAEIRIGRRSVSRGIEPEIDLIGPPRDPGVSRLHAKLVPAPGGTWTVVDLGTENGITVNDRDIPAGDSVPLRPGDRIHLGAWTQITITRG
jgi:serine/threonine protein kinase